MNTEYYTNKCVDVNKSRVWIVWTRNARESLEHESLGYDTYPVKSETAICNGT